MLGGDGGNLRVEAAEGLPSRTTQPGPRTPLTGLGVSRGENPRQHLQSTRSGTAADVSLPLLLWTLHWKAPASSPRTEGKRSVGDELSRSRLLFLYQV